MAAKAPSAVTLATLLAELTSLRALATSDGPTFTAKLASSYDRASTSPDADGWFANKDSGQFIRQEGEEFVMVDADGPGVITRMWSPNPSGTLRIYIDDASAPSVEAPMDAFLAGMVPPFVAPFAFSIGKGSNLYFPIPFAEHIKITTTSSTDDLYYQVNYRSYVAGSALESLDLTTDFASVAAYGEARAGLHTPAQHVATSQERPLDAAHPTWVTLNQHGPAALTSLRLSVSSMEPSALRATILELRFDGVQTVRVPLGDFFGAGHLSQSARSMAFECDDEHRTLTTHFVMPFAHSAEIKLTATTGTPLTAKVSSESEARANGVPPLYFRAGWTGPMTFDVEQPRDLTLARLRGRGHYVGVVLNVANPDPQWWGEGDEKIYVDDERFPSEFGTGTEDYFDYGWCSTELFSSPFAAQTHANASNNAGHVSLYRIHTLDRIPFTSSFRFDLEALHWATYNRSVQMAYDALYFWYGDADAVDLQEQVPASSFTIPPLAPGIDEQTPGSPTSC